MAHSGGGKRGVGGGSGAVEVASVVRKSLVERAGEVKVKDPSSHAKRSVEELDKTAKKSLAKRKLCDEQLEADQKELHLIEEQIKNIRLRYDPLVQLLKENKEKKENLIKTLESCNTEEKNLMVNMKSTVHSRLKDDSKVSSKNATLQLAALRGFTMDSDSTFHQKKSHSHNEEEGSKKAASATLKKTTPPLGSGVGTKK